LTEGSGNRNLPRFCDYEGSDYRTAFWEGRGREYEDRAERIALRRLLPLGGRRLIDIGGGFGRLAELYSGFNEIVLMDYSRSQLEDALQRLGPERITYVAANVFAMPFTAGAFDTAVSVRVLHHLADVPRALQAIRRVLGPGAPLVLEFANKRNLKAILRHWLHRQAHNPFDPEPWEFAPLHFDFHPAYMERSLRDAGFRIERQLAVSQFRVQVLKRLFGADALAAVDGWLQRPTAFLRLAPSMFLRARAGGEAGAPASPLFCCPTCRGRLAHEHDALLCTDCGRRWSNSGGIYDFRQPLNDGDS